MTECPGHRNGVGRMKRGLDHEQGHLSRLPSIQHKSLHTGNEGPINYECLDAFIYLLDPHGTLSMTITSDGDTEAHGKSADYRSARLPHELPLCPPCPTPRSIIWSSRATDGAGPLSPPAAMKSRSPWLPSPRSHPKAAPASSVKHTPGPRTDPQGRPGSFGHTARGAQETNSMCAKGGFLDQLA